MCSQRRSTLAVEFAVLIHWHTGQHIGDVRLDVLQFGGLQYLFKNVKAVLPIAVQHRLGNITLGGEVQWTTIVQGQRTSGTLFAVAGHGGFLFAVAGCRDGVVR